MVSFEIWLACDGLLRVLGGTIKVASDRSSRGKWFKLARLCSMVVKRKRASFGVLGKPVNSKNELIP